MQNTELQRLQQGELLPTKDNITALATEIIRQCQEGEADTLQMIVKVTAIHKTTEAVLEGLKEEALRELAKHGKDGAMILSAGIKQMEAGVKYDYSQDAEWRALKETVDAANADLKDRETFLKGVKSPFETLDKSTGEMVTIYPPKKTSTTTFKITLK